MYSLAKIFCRVTHAYHVSAYLFVKEEGFLIAEINYRYREKPLAVYTGVGLADRQQCCVSPQTAWSPLG